MSEAHGVDDPLNEKPPVSNDELSDSSIWGSDDEGMVSQTVKIRRDHHTAGYVDGVTAYKDEALQIGFDDGFPTGAEIGLQVGKIVGTLQGLGLKELEEQALEELSIEKLFCPAYFDKEANATWQGTHPLVDAWLKKLSVIQTGVPN
jgi:hypothetical protein